MRCCLNNIRRSCCRIRTVAVVVTISNNFQCSWVLRLDRVILLKVADVGIVPIRFVEMLKRVFRKIQRAEGGIIVERKGA
ncbi:hypothetical protein SDC9_193956 [bioreactor metagenome]|uniref:Uncharacterized protein n=1 Tax=bioreactor metagenome TaxID=1076179 RepID=A0A645I5I8_9ZZZZ